MLKFSSRQCACFYTWSVRKQGIRVLGAVIRTKIWKTTIVLAGTSRLRDNVRLTGHRQKLRFVWSSKQWQT